MKLRKKSKVHFWERFARAYSLPISWLIGVPIVLGLVVAQSSLVSLQQVLILGLVASVPALVHLGLAKFLEEEWAQALVLVAWTSLAALAIAAPGNVYTPFIGFAVLPIVAAVSFGGMRRVLEATALTSIIVTTIAIAAGQGLLPQVHGSLLAMPGLELAGLVLNLVVVGTGLASVLPLIDRQARLREALFRKSPHLDFCLDRNNAVVCASDMAKSWSRANNLGDLLKDEAAYERAKKVIENTFANRDSSSIIIPVGVKERSHLLQVRYLDQHQIMISFRDVAKQLATREQLINERNAAIAASRDKTLFLASMSHELRTPLNAIIGFSDMMKARLFGPIPAKYAEYADLIHESGRHLVDLVGDVLDMSKIESDNYRLAKEDFDFNEVVRSCVKLMKLSADEAGVSLQLDLPTYPVRVVADRKALRQIMFNLLSNGIKFTPSEGKVTSKVELVGDQVLLEVSDNGVGMSTGDAKRVGQPFQQAQSAKASEARGTGLGLSLVKALAELHKGKFALQSELGQGTSISLELPIIDKARMDKAKVQALDVRSHIRRAQAASEQIAAISARLSS